MKNITKKIIILFIIVSISLSIGYFFDPTNLYERKWIENTTQIYNDDNKFVGSLRVEGLYKSKGAITSNEPVEFYITEVDYYINKIFLKESVGSVHETMDARICPENARLSDNDREKSKCIDIELKKLNDNEFITYRYFYVGDSPQNVVKFLTSGKHSLVIEISPRYLTIEDVFEVDPHYINVELQLNRYVFWLSIIVLIGIIVQTIEWIGFLELIDACTRLYKWICKKVLFLEKYIGL